MTLFSLRKRALILLAVALSLTGCFQMAGGPEDEEKDPHYLAGKSRISSMDYDGAITAFENALVSNPKSAAAHLQLGLLFEERKNDYAAAIYHFDKHLELKPDSNMAEAIKQHVIACKLELAKTVPFALVNQFVQDEMRRLTTSNAVLNEQVAQLKAQIVDQAASFSNRLAATVAQVALQSQTQVQIATEPERRSIASSRAPSPIGINPAPTHASPTPRTHEIKSGETLATIARRYNVKLSALEAANPRVEPRRLRVGQVLNLPAR